MEPKVEAGLKKKFVSAISALQKDVLNLEEQKRAILNSSNWSGDIIDCVEPGFEVGDTKIREAKRLIAQYEEAIKRLDAGTYGICEDCDNPISPKRLEKLPSSKRCIICQNAQEARGRLGQKGAPIPLKRPIQSASPC